MENNYKVIRRNGRIVPFNEKKIENALVNAFTNCEGAEVGPDGRQDVARALSIVVKDTLFERQPMGANFNIEEVQDRVESTLMANNYPKVAKHYILYRQKRAEERKAKSDEFLNREIKVNKKNGDLVDLDVHEIHSIIEQACHGLDGADPEKLLSRSLMEMYNGISEEEVYSALYLSGRALIEQEPAYSKVSARLLLDFMRLDMMSYPIKHAQMIELYPKHFRSMLERGIEIEILNPDLMKIFDIERLGKTLVADRDLQFEYLGLQTLYDRYFINDKENGEKRIEMPQSFFMRVAMGLALGEKNPTERAIEFYNLLSTFRFMSSTPTLFNSGTTHSQLSSCYLTTVEDDLYGIFTAYQENALLAKFAGGLGNDWTPVRSMGSHIKGTNGKSQGVVPFLKIVNDTAVAVNQGGKRKGAVCTYLETWHMDIEEFLELRKNTGDERRRTHDMNTANWIPDLFMKRVISDGDWYLFSPYDTPDLHDLYGKKFEEAYNRYEKRAENNEINHKKISAVSLWRKMLTMLFETGHPWITFKDTCNIRSPQQHVGVVHSSNLCTEITLNTNEEEIAVCNLGSINLPAHLKDGKLDAEMLKSTITTAMRMLDNVIDINFYAVEKARISNQRHRPVGMGIMGFQDCLYELGFVYDSQQAIDFADKSMELIAWNAYYASSMLAEERGCYSTYKGSLWDQGILPNDTLKLLSEERGTGDAIEGEYFEINMEETLDWDALKKRIKEHGMRNSNCLAIAPTATIANIVGVTASIEPSYQNIYVKSNLSGEFTVVNKHLILDLKKVNLWDDAMMQDIKYYDGEVEKIERIPNEIKNKYPTAFNTPPKALIECAARRQKWIDQGQSLNLYLAEPSGSKMEAMYKLAWKRGLKTTYYLRTMGATSTEKYTAPTGAFNKVDANAVQAPKACSIEDPECEACQ